MVLHVGTLSVLGSPCAGEEVDRQGEKRTVAVEIRSQPRKADGGGHTRLRQRAAVFGGETRLLAVFWVLSGLLGGWERHNYKLGSLKPPVLLNRENKAS